MDFKTIALVLAICTTLMELFPFSNAAVCKHCNTSNNECFVDTFGITYCNGVLVSYPEQLELTKYYVDTRCCAIGEGAFSENDFLQDVFIPDGVIVIGDNAFEGCSRLSTVHLPDSLLIIGSNAFTLCTLLEDIDLPLNLHSIGWQAFCDTWSLKEVAFPETLRFVGDEAFAYSGVKEVFVHSVYIQCGYDVFTPDSLKAGDNLMLHFREDVFSEEIGDVSAWIEEIQQVDGITVIFDIPAN